MALVLPCAHLCISDAQLVDVLDGGDDFGALVAHQLGACLLPHDHNAGVAPLCRRTPRAVSADGCQHLCLP